MRLGQALASVALIGSLVACVEALAAQSPAGGAASAAVAPGDFALQGPLSQGGMVIGTAPAGTTVLTLDGAPIRLAPDGRFLIGFGRDHGPAALLVATRGDGTMVRDPLTIAPRQWHIEALPIPKGTTPTPEFLAKRKLELDQIAAARALLPESDGWRQRFAWPVIGRISGLFGSQRIYQGEKGSFHSGLDIAQPTGTPVAAPADGVVILAADHPFSLEGNLLMIDHGMGLSSSFLHLSRIDVHVGDQVRQGQPIGLVGMTGRATGPHLHWSLRWRDERLDPLLLMGGPPPGQTLPVEGASGD